MNQDAKDSAMQKSMEWMAIPERFNETSHAVMGAGLAQMLSQGLSYLITQDAVQRERDYQRQQQEKHIEMLKLQHQQDLRLKELELMGRAQYIPQPQSQPQPQPTAVNPYRNCQTVGQLEVLLLQQQACPQRESILKDLARYPQDMPLHHLPSHSVKLLTGR
jgi:hypothetical protein